MEEQINYLVKSIKNGNIGSFEKLVNQNANRVSNIIYHMLGNANNVDDLAQEVFIKIYKNIKYFREESKFSTWLYRITVNTVWDFLRKKKIRKNVPLEEIGPIPIASKITKNIREKELKELLYKEIYKIPLKYRTVLILKEIGGLSYKEIAEISKCRIGTVESRLFRARKKLLEKLKKSKWWREFL